MIVNTDADNQYYGRDVARLVAADPRRPRRHGRRRPRGDRHRALLAAEEDAAAARLVGRAPGVLDVGPRHDLGLSRLQPRGGDPDARRLEVHLHARDDHPGRQAARRRSTTSRSARTRRRASRACSRRWAPTCGATPSRSSASTRSTSRCACSGASRSLIGLAAVGRLDPLRRRLRRRQRQGPRAVADPRRRAVHRRRRAVGARRDRRPARGAARDDAADVRARAADRARSSASRPRTTNRATPAPERPGTARRPGSEPDGPSASGGAAVSGVTVSDDGIVTGNTYDKYGSTNPVVRRLMAGFERTLDELLARADPRSLLDVGCGEGVLVQRWAQRLPDARRRRHRPRGGVDPGRLGAAARRRTSSTARCPPRICRSPTSEFELASAIEVLEHVPDPERTLAEMARCAERHLLVSVPREPLWRGAEHGARRVHRAARQHAGPPQPLVQALVRQAALAHGQIVELRSPFPWTMLLVRL